LKFRLLVHTFHWCLSGIFSNQSTDEFGWEAYTPLGLLHVCLNVALFRTFASLPLFGVGKYAPEGYLTGCSFDYLSSDLTTKIFVLVFFIAAWMVPLSIIIYSYSSIMRTVAHVRRDVAQADNGDARPLTFIGGAEALTRPNDLATNQVAPIYNAGKNTY